MTKNDQGVLIIAQGERYINLACNLAMSLRLNSPQFPIALVTESKDEKLKKIFDFIIPPNNDKGIGFEQKVNMYHYSPFKKTLFIDADCMVCRNIFFLFNLADGHKFTVIGRKVYEGTLLNRNVQELLSYFHCDYLLTFNGGVYYFEKSEEALQVFNKAIDIYNNEYDRLQLIKFNGKKGDEPVFSIAASVCRMEPIDDNGTGMYTPVGQHGQFSMDVLKGICTFNKYDKIVSPAIMHFGGGYPEAFHYRRELKKLMLVYSFGLKRNVSSFIVEFIYNPVYIIYVFIYRVIKWGAGKGKPKFTPVMPMFRFL